MSELLKKENIQKNLNSIYEKIAQASEKANRNSDEVTLVAVTKSVDTETIEMLIDLGIKHIGENKIQDAKNKYETLKNPHQVTWHMIGHLQTNKVKLAVSIFDTFHSVDSVKLATEISKNSSNIMKILIQVNVSKEESKQGFFEEELLEKVSEISPLENISICGLMTMAPFNVDLEICREYFRKTRILGEKLRDKGHIQQEKLEFSMGMSQDFGVAVEEGATLIRVGSTIFS